MRIFQLFFYSIILLSLSCEKTEVDVPNCIHDKIESYSKNPTLCDSGATVEEYLFQSELVYVFNPGTCGADMGADVFTESCENIGFLGGIAGNTIIQGVQFYEESVFQRVVWEKQ